ncbi:MAG: hypothetical protein Q4E36_06575 [Bacillota bacterium]|nr:hypothetical protein [Bacillota bacterium]
MGSIITVRRENSLADIILFKVKITEPKIKNEAEKNLSSLGRHLSNAVDVFYRQIILNKLKLLKKDELL